MPKHKISNDSQEFGARLVELLNARGHPRRGAGAYLAGRYKVSSVTANDWLNGKFRPDTTLAKAIAEDHGSTFERLYFGTTAKSANLSRYRVLESDGDDGAQSITMTDARGSCGGGTIQWDLEQRQALLKEPAWFRRYKVTPQTALAVWADGDSMADFIVDGDIVIFNTSKTTPRSGAIFLLEHPDGLRIKRLRREIDGTWVLESDNADKRRFPDERITADHIDILKIRGEFVYRQGG